VGCRFKSDACKAFVLKLLERQRYWAGHYRGRAVTILKGKKGGGRLETKKNQRSVLEKVKLT
jgi:hypothetical protein